MAQRICAAGSAAALCEALAVEETEVLLELVDLNDWVRPLNVLDGALEAVLLHHPALIAVWDHGRPSKPRVVPAYLANLYDSVAKVRACVTSQPASQPVFLSAVRAPHASFHAHRRTPPSLPVCSSPP